MNFNDWWQLRFPPDALAQLSSLSTPLIIVFAILHTFLFGFLWLWYRRDLRVIAGCLDHFTRGFRHRSVLEPVAPVASQIDAFIQDVREVLDDPKRKTDRVECLRRLHILDERRRYLYSPAFETSCHTARTMIEAYPLAGVLGTILAIGSALQSGPVANAAETMSGIVARFGDAIWSTFFGLVAAIGLMFLQSLLEIRFHRLTELRSEVRDTVARAKRELGLAVASGEVEGP